MIDAKTKQKLIDEISRFGNIYISCLSVGISRADYYRWVKKDKKFKERAKEALRIGRKNFVDVCEGALMKNIKNGNQRAIEYGLRFNSNRYKTNKTKKESIEEIISNMSDQEFFKLTKERSLPPIEVVIVGPKKEK